MVACCILLTSNYPKEITMIKAFKNMGAASVRLIKAIGSSFATFGREIACAFKGCDGSNGSCCK